MFSRTSTTILFLTITGLLLCGPVFGSEIQRWPIEKSLYGANEDHIKGDVFRVVVSYTNLTADSLRDAVGIIYYPDGVFPYRDKLYQRQLTKGPWPGHFVDEKRSLIRFELGSGLKRDYNEFFSYFEADIYGSFDFDYSIEWTDVSGLRRRVTKNNQEIVIPDSIEIAEIPVVQTKTLRSYGLTIPLLIALGILIFAIGCGIGLIFRKRKQTIEHLPEPGLNELIDKFERENAELRELIAQEARKLDDANGNA